MFASMPGRTGCRSAWWTSTTGGTCRSTMTATVLAMKWRIGSGLPGIDRLARTCADRRRLVEDRVPPGLGNQHLLLATRRPAGAGVDAGATFSLNSNWRLIDWRRFSSTRWGVAKLVRRLTLDQVILGSNPSAPAIVLSQDIADACRKTLWTGQRPLRGW